MLLISMFWQYDQDPLPVRQQDQHFFFYMFNSGRLLMCSTRVERTFFFLFMCVMYFIIFFVQIYFLM